MKIQEKTIKNKRYNTTTKHRITEDIVRKSSVSILTPVLCLPQFYVLIKYIIYFFYRQTGKYRCTG